jgi:hypothetical protein
MREVASDTALEISDPKSMMYWVRRVFGVDPSNGER